MGSPGPFPPLSQASRMGNVSLARKVLAAGAKVDSKEKP